MKNSFLKKIILWTLGLLLIAILIFLYFFTKQNKESLVDISKEEKFETINNSYTNNQPSNNIQNNAQPSTTSPKETIVPRPNIKQDESEVTKEIEKKLVEWKTTNDVNKLREALQITGNPDNETFFGPWIEFLKKNSSALFSLIQKNSTKDEIETIYFIYEWFIYGSTEFEGLTIDKRQELENQYFKIQNILKEKGGL